MVAGQYFPSFLPLLVVLFIIVARRPANLLKRRGAVGPETAQPLDDLSARDRARLERLMAQGIVREATPGRYYFDQAGERARMRRQMPVLIGIIVFLLVVALAMAVYLAAHRTPAA